jgi:integrase/recombinase XerD
MIETLFKPARVVSRFQQGPLGPWLEELATCLVQRRYSRDVIRNYLWSVKNFGEWLSEQRLSLSELDESIVSRYLSRFPRRLYGGLSHASGGLTPLLRLLRLKGVAASPRPSPPRTVADQWLWRFEQHLEMKGTATGTRARYLFFVRRFIGTRFETGRWNWQCLQGQDVADFVCQEARTRTGLGRKAPGVALRAFLRFLVGCGEVRLGLEAAVPIMRQPTHVGLPRHLSIEEVTRVLDNCQDGTPKGLRNYAILLLLARLGLRAHEISALRLEDIDWRDGSLLIRAGKTPRERRLPLLQEVGRALVAYLTQARPDSESRMFFLSCRAPYLPLIKRGVITHIAHRCLQRIGFPSARPMGAHTFRHTVATAMVCQGASFKDVADVLGHQCLHTTAIYAKLDLPSLAKIALPWPGGVR